MTAPPAAASASPLGPRAARLLGRLVQGWRVLHYRLLSTGRVVQRGRVRRLQPVLVAGAGVVELHDCQLGVRPSPHLYAGYIHLEAREASARICIGPGACLNNNLTVIAERTCVSIGAGVLAGVNVSIYDSDFHALDPAQRSTGTQATAPVTIGANVFLGSNVTVLKGVTIGADSVIASGSVVTRDIPPGVCAAGVPCRVLGPLTRPASAPPGVLRGDA